jgi:hypothetical protein
MSKKPINEINITGFLSKFFDELNSGTQKRFIAKAKKRGVPTHVVNKLTQLEKDYIELTHILRDL